MWWITYSRFDAHLAPGLTRKVCQTVLFHHDLIWSVRISECCRTSRHRLLNVFQHLRTHWPLERLRHAHQLSDKGATNIPVTKNKLSSLCNCVWLCFVWILSGKNSVPVSEITPVPLLSETNKRQNWFRNCTRVEKHSNCSSFWKHVCHQASSVMLESSSTCGVDSRIKQRYLLSWMREAVHQLVSL